MIENLKPLLPYILGGICLSVISFFVWAHTNSEHMVSYFGAVAAVEEDAIVIVDRAQQERTLSVSADVAVVRRDETLHLSDVTVGDFVHASGKRVGEGEVVITMVRLLRPPHMQR